MRASVLAVVFLLTVSMAVAQPADSQIPEASTLPGSASYTVNSVFERVSLALTFNQEKKAEKRIDLAEKRLAEARALAERNRTEDAERVMERYARQMSEAQATAERLPDDRRDNIERRISDATETHGEVLADVLKQVPDEAREGIRTALQESGSPVRVPERVVGEDGRLPVYDGAPGYVATGKVVR